MVHVTWLGFVTGCLIAGGCGRRSELPVRLPPETTSSRAVRVPASRADAANATAQDLYAQHCRACHGADGDGRGPAARYLFPKPRNFRSGKFRLVSTARGVATADDIRRVVREGLVGSSMPAFRNMLDEAAQEKLVDEVLRLRQEGLAAWVRQTALEEFPDEAPTDAEVDEIVEHRLAPGPPVAVPSFGPVTPEMLRQGQALYARQDCPRCHGREGTGAEDSYLLDDEGYPTRARNLVFEEFKGGPQPEAIYLRIWLGIPGTPMPAHRSLRDSELIALVQSVRFLARTPAEPETNYLRALRALRAIDYTRSRITVR
jgi:mono/diheme cytochrome c family protein